LRSTNSEPATVFPVGVALAATWDPALVEEVGSAIAREAIAHDVDVLLAPGVNIQRTPIGGRNFEYYSEDPLLSGDIGAAYVRGVQSEGVGTSLKHFAANNQEHNRMSVSSNMTERVLREIYLPAFEHIVRTEKPWTIMSAYNRLNGVFCSENQMLLNNILRSEWGYEGVVVSDWGAAKSTVGSANGGLDLEMPGPGRMYGEALTKAVDEGEVSQETIDSHARRVILLIARCGLLSGNPKKSRAALCTDEHRNLAARAATDGCVLLKNNNQTLPINTTELIAVIGALADTPAIQGGGSSQVIPDRVITPLDALRTALPNSEDIPYERGIDPEAKIRTIDRRLLSVDEDGRIEGLDARYFASENFNGPMVYEAVEQTFARLGFGEKAQKSGNVEFSVEWSGYLTPRYSGVHEFLLTDSAFVAELYLNDALVQAEVHGEMLFMVLPLNKRKASMNLEAGQAYPIRLRYRQSSQNAIAAFNIFEVGLREPEPNAQDAIALARTKEHTLLFVGPGQTSETEGEDRASMQLSDEQNTFISEVAAASMKTTVVVNCGGPIEMPWIDEVDAILLTWLPGQECGQAVADLLVGKASPSGKLPTTFPKRYEDNPTADFYPGADEVEYGEGMSVGYRHYDTSGVTPLFAFGHGLTYTDFDITDCSVRIDETTSDLMVSALIKNSGQRQGLVTLQVYIEPHHDTDGHEVKHLAGFKKVRLEPGEEQLVILDIADRALRYWDERTAAWESRHGTYTVHIGRASDQVVATIEMDL
ncbi:MAG: glycoside hydrolase family 3 C-terminal domain-containing protein, partial [Pseudomonadota bacterium]